MLAPRPIRHRSLMQHLQLEAACFATQIPSDIADLAAQFPERVTGLVLCVPTRLDTRAFAHVAPRLLIIAGEAGLSAETSRHALAQLPGAREHILPGYNAQGWSDVVADRTSEIVGAIISFLRRSCSGMPNCQPAGDKRHPFGAKLSGRRPRAAFSASAVPTRTLAMGTGLGGAGATLRGDPSRRPSHRWRGGTGGSGGSSNIPGDVSAPDGRYGATGGRPYPGCWVRLWRARSVARHATRHRSSD
jgi:hypothetical protein